MKAEGRWEPGLPFILFLALFFALWTVRATLLIPIDQSISSSEARSLYSTSVKLILWLLPAMAFAKWVRKEDPITYLGLGAVPDWKTWAASFLAIGLFCALVLSFEIFVSQKTIYLENRPAGLAVGAAFYLVSPWVEEVFFRGLVLRELSTFMRFSLSNLATSGLFVGIHLPYWIYSGTQGQVIAADSAGIFLFSLFAGWLYSRSKSVWPSTAAHIANNILSSMIKAG